MKVIKIGYGFRIQTKRIRKRVPGILILKMNLPDDAVAMRKMKRRSPNLSSNH
jgi:hypothetical protein